MDDMLMRCAAMCSQLSFARSSTSVHVSFLQVMHGADNDVLWLQRDYGAYLVNVLDTEKCCQVGSPCNAGTERSGQIPGNATLLPVWTGLQLLLYLDVLMIEVDVSQEFCILAAFTICSSLQQHGSANDVHESPDAWHSVKPAGAQEITEVSSASSSKVLQR